jgi:hypothetical protein
LGRGGGWGGYLTETDKIVTKLKVTFNSSNHEGIYRVGGWILIF